MVTQINTHFNVLVLLVVSISLAQMGGEKLKVNTLFQRLALVISAFSLFPILHHSEKSNTL